MAFNDHFISVIRSRKGHTDILVIKMFSEENAVFIWNIKSTKLFPVGSEEGR
jgi:hypothetical protein